MNMPKSNGFKVSPSASDTSHKMSKTSAAKTSRSMVNGRTAVWQARLVLLVMVNIAQLWILSATIEAALAGEYKQLVPLISASAICWTIALTIYLWWKPAPPRRPNA